MAQPALQLAPGTLTPGQYDRLLKALHRLLAKGRRREEEAVGRQLVRTYHAVGSRLLQQKLSGKAGYGAAVIARLADDLHVDERTLHRAMAFARAYPDGPGPWQVSNGGGVQPRWSMDGSELYFINGDSLMRARVRGGTMFAFDEPVELFDARRLGIRALEYDALPGGGFLMVRQIPGTDPSDLPALMLVQGWQSTLEPGE